MTETMPAMVLKGHGGLDMLVTGIDPGQFRPACRPDRADRGAGGVALGLGLGIWGHNLRLPGRLHPAILEHGSDHSGGHGPQSGRGTAVCAGSTQ